MKTTIVREESHILVSIDGRIDTTTAKEFELRVAEILQEECSNIVVDCANLSYISSSGLRVFLILQKGVNAKQGALVLRSMSDPIKEIFKITGFTSIFNIE